MAEVILPGKSEVEENEDEENKKEKIR